MPAAPKALDQTAQAAALPSAEQISTDHRREVAAELLELDKPPAYPNADLLDELGKVRGRLHDLERSDERTAAQLTELWESHAQLSKSLEDSLRAFRESLDGLTAALERTAALTPEGG